MLVFSEILSWEINSNNKCNNNSFTPKPRQGPGRLQEAAGHCCPMLWDWRHLAGEDRGWALLGSTTMPQPYAEHLLISPARKTYLFNKY